jgi:hypothetical protein
LPSLQGKKKLASLIDPGDLQKLPHAPGDFCQKETSSIWKIECSQNLSVGRHPAIPSIGSRDRWGHPWLCDEGFSGVLLIKVT